MTSYGYYQTRVDRENYFCTYLRKIFVATTFDTTFRTRKYLGAAQLLVEAPALAAALRGELLGHHAELLAAHQKFGGKKELVIGSNIVKQISTT